MSPLSPIASTLHELYMSHFTCRCLVLTAVHWIIVIAVALVRNRSIGQRNSSIGQRNRSVDISLNWNTVKRLLRKYFNVIGLQQTDYSYFAGAVLVITVSSLDTY